MSLRGHRNALHAGEMIAYILDHRNSRYNMWNLRDDMVGYKCERVWTKLKSILGVSEAIRSGVTA